MLRTIFRYILLGLAVAAASHAIPKRSLDFNETFSLAVTGAVTFWVLDTFAPEVGAGARTGAGFGVGAKLAGF